MYMDKVHIPGVRQDYSNPAAQVHPPVDHEQPALKQQAGWSRA